uniref:Extracellular matrix protein 1b n=1 Tax=Oryzias latipes TaxID=8090 RepID=A0A3P9I7P4_ORYLA
MQSAAVLLSALIPAELPAGPTRSPQEWAPLGLCSAPSLWAWFCGAQLWKIKLYGIPRQLEQQPFQDQRLFEQRPITVVFGQEMIYDDHFLMQEEVDLSSFSDLHEGLQRPIFPSFYPKRRGVFTSGVMIPRGSQPAVEQYPVSFPLSQPSANNIEAICAHGEHRPRYPQSYFPPSGYSKLKRMAAAVNNAESWFGICCNQNQTLQNNTVLCCATQAWELSVKLFCEEDSSVKDLLYECCWKRGSSRLKCFNADSPNPNYEPTEELPVLSIPPDSEFNFDPSNCPRKLLTPRSTRINNKNAFKKIDMNFPLGQPTADNIESLCRMWRQRPFYSSKCLQRSGYEFAARQAKSINSLEKEFRQCCTMRDHKLNCASQKWREEVEKFCLVEKKHTSFECCSGDDPSVWSGCFKSMSPDPHYNTSAPEAPSFSELCKNPTIKYRLPIDFPLETFRSECCSLSVPLKTICSKEKLGEPPSPDVKMCCRLMHDIAKATNPKKKRKICPIPKKSMSLAFV